MTSWTVQNVSIAEIKLILKLTMSELTELTRSVIKEKNNDVKADFIMGLISANRCFFDLYVQNKTLVRLSATASEAF